MYSSDITRAVAAERHRRYLCEAARRQRPARTRREARANPKLAGRVHIALLWTGC
jgi:hypothetical protein